MSLARYEESSKANVTLLGLGIFATCLTFAALFAWHKPIVGWDAVAYMALESISEGASLTSAHADVYSEIHANSRFSHLASDTSEHEELSRSPIALGERLSFWSIRPGYVALLRALHSTGISKLDAGRLLSILAFCATAVLALIWMQRYISGTAALFWICFIALTPIALEPARRFTPDALAAFLVLLGLYCALEKLNFKAGFLILVLSVFVRTDNIVVLVMLAGMLFLTRGVRERWVPVSSVLVGVVCVLSINKLAGYPGWAALLQESFGMQLTVAGYLGVFLRSLAYMRESYMLVVATLFLATLWLERNPWRPMPITAAAVVLGVSTLARFALYPTWELRQYALLAIGSLIAFPVVIGTRRLHEGIDRAPLARIAGRPEDDIEAAA